MKKYIAIIVTIVTFALCPLAQTSPTEQTPQAISQLQTTTAKTKIATAENQQKVRSTTDNTKAGNGLIALLIMGVGGVVSLVIAWKISRPMAKILNFFTRLGGQECPTCGRTIHNADQCPYCGYKFSTAFFFFTRLAMFIVILMFLFVLVSGTAGAGL